jgi:hypothetical protein
LDGSSRYLYFFARFPGGPFAWNLDNKNPSSHGGEQDLYNGGYFSHATLPTSAQGYDRPVPLPAGSFRGE